MTSKKECITIKEVFEILSVSRDTFRRWDKAGTLKAKRHPMNIRIYDPAEVEALRKAILEAKAE